MLKKIVLALQIVMNVLVVIIGIWIVFYAFEKNLPALLGEELFLKLYHGLTTMISVCAVLVIILTIVYLFDMIFNKKDS